jgi:ribosomal protein L11 methylase PrmA
MPGKLLLTLIIALGFSGHATARGQPDVGYVPTPQPVVERMLELAQVGPDDLVYDLGSGDGRIVITAAQQYGARGVGIDIDPQRISEAKQNAREARVTGQVRFIEGDLFQADLSPATVVTMYLLPGLNDRLRPKLLAELRPGARIVSHAFDIKDWTPQRTVNVGSDTIYLWTIPEKTRAAR